MGVGVPSNATLNVSFEILIGKVRGFPPLAGYRAEPDTGNQDYWLCSRVRPYCLYFLCHIDLIDPPQTFHFTRSLQDAVEALDYAAKGKVKCQYTVRQLEDLERCALYSSCEACWLTPP